MLFVSKKRRTTTELTPLRQISGTNKSRRRRISPPNEITRQSSFPQEFVLHKLQQWKCSQQTWRQLHWSLQQDAPKPFIRSQLWLQVAAKEQVVRSKFMVLGSRPRTWSVALTTTVEPSQSWSTFFCSRWTSKILEASKKVIPSHSGLKR